MSDVIARYLAGPRLPWSDGYGKYKNTVIADTLADDAMMERFRTGAALPKGFGDRLDERVVEYPWTIARLDPKTDLILDAGSTFNAPLILDSEQVKGRRIVIYTLLSDWMKHDMNLSYIHGDFRQLLLRDRCVQSVVCISTLEHVGLGANYTLYNISKHAPDQDLLAYRGALAEFHRALEVGGQFLLTVPYGRRENHGWLQQFDAETLADVIASFPGKLVRADYYRYRKGGWSIASAEDCADASYYNIHHAPGFEDDYAAAARAVACLEFRRVN